jgi:hypothetical protein
MRYCEKCKVKILDDTEYCPLCHNVIKNTNEEEESFDFFPDVYGKKKLSGKIAAFLLFCTLVCFIFAIYFDMILNMNAGVLFMITAGFAYATMVLNFVNRETGYLMQMFTYTIAGVLLILLLDSYTGFNGWSVDYVLPGAILLVNLVLIILMFANSRNWQGYMASQLLMLLIGIIPVVLINIGVVKHPVVSEIAVLSCIIVFLGTLILGGRTAREELKRRFHI